MTGGEGGGANCSPYTWEQKRRKNRLGPTVPFQDLPPSDIRPPLGHLFIEPFEYGFWRCFRSTLWHFARSVRSEEEPRGLEQRSVEAECAVLVPSRPVGRGDLEARGGPG